MAVTAQFAADRFCATFSEKLPKVHTARLADGAGADRATFPLASTIRSAMLSLLLRRPMRPSAASLALDAERGTSAASEANAQPRQRHMHPARVRSGDAARC